MVCPLAKAMATLLGSTIVIGAWAQAAAALAEATPISTTVARPARDSHCPRSAGVVLVNWRPIVANQKNLIMAAKPRKGCQ
jgi:hypothetical protein